LAFFTKVQELPAGFDKEGRARSAFYGSNDRCRETNVLLKQWSRGEFSFQRDVEVVLFHAQRKISKVLGDVPSLDQLDFTFGPGATTSVPKRNACARTKLSAVPSCTTNLLPYVPALLRQVPHYSSLHAVSASEEGDDEVVEVVPVELHHGRLSFVAKNAKTHRSVLTEATLNALYQHGLGEYIASRLRRIGQDTTDQVRNQLLAREGSLTGALATLDLSSASDSISIELVAHLVPPEWFDALRRCRTNTVSDNGVLTDLHMFSSMGNGYTFPLQTLIFWALAASASEVSKDAETRVSVYGDDIIVGTATVPLLAKVLTATGFRLNREKSYWSGPFRESCGKDYYLGIDIRPFYQRRKVTGESLFVLHNYYVRHGLDDLASLVLKWIDPCIRIFGPDGFGDGHLLGTFPRRYHKRDLGYSGFLFDTFVWVGSRHKRLLPGDRVLPLYTVYARDLPEVLVGPYRVRTAGVPISFNGDIPTLPIPGKGKYKRISIYTLTPPTM
jgi:hypothetical protein